MTTVAELIAKLQTLPQDAEVECGIEIDDGVDPYYNHMVFTPIDINNTKVWDFTKDKKSNLYGKFIVQLMG